MGLNVRDVESAYLDAQVEVEQWRQDFLEAWHKPEIELLLTMLYQHMDPEMKRYFKLTNPAAFNQLEARVKQAQQGGQNGLSGKPQ